nr:glycosyl transferase [Actinomycetota bacterium]
MDIRHTVARVRSKVLYLLQLDRRLQHWDDARYLKLLFRLRTGKRLDLDTPKTFSEKLQWLKLHDRQPLYTALVDKYEVKQWVAERIGAEYVVPNLGIWDSFDEIDFDALPEQFVLKCTHDSGGLVICRDRATFDVAAAKARIERSLARNYFYLGREWPYRDVPPRVLAEVYLPTWTPDGASTSEEDATADGVVDYKFYCFHGEPEFLYVSQDLHDHDLARRTFLRCDWTPAGFGRHGYRGFEDALPQPPQFEEMMELARVLSAGIPFVRVDLFAQHGHVLFSELTFHPVSGMIPFDPRSADLEIGRSLDLSVVKPAP